METNTNEQAKELAIKYLKSVYDHEIKLSIVMMIVLGILMFFIVRVPVAVGYNIFAILLYIKYRSDRKEKLDSDIEKISNT